MSIPNLLEPKEINVKGKKFIISKLPACAGREIGHLYAPSIAPKIKIGTVELNGDYATNELIMKKLMAFVAVKSDNGTEIRLDSQTLIDQHVYKVGEDAWLMLREIENEMIAYNCAFFRDGRISNFLDSFGQIFQDVISTASTTSSEHSSPATNTESSN